ncbi:carbohydrate sulfotransferase 4-like [Helicoverpa zea]|uniref:carbohydrate sulfotransferase 4-like n=1 Tax=Helicoverpa zea TaxID=7113 RepID=UPI001F576390|nr:carbohydrate sulfotransferase 4-like [Helicoverpa zea]
MVNIRTLIARLARLGRRIYLLFCVIVFIIIATNYNKKMFLNEHIKEKSSKPKLTTVYKVPSCVYKVPSHYIKEHVSTARAKLNYQLSFYNFSLNLDNLVMESGGRPLRSLILSTWKSGTTFLGEILNAIPGSYYFYEPLLMYGVKQIREREQPEADIALHTITSLLKCNYETLKKYLEFARERVDQLRRNTRIWHHCKFMKHLCCDFEFMSQICMLFPFQVMKLVRLRLKLIPKILDDKELNVKLIFLVRDPRGMMHSRRNVEFCPNTIDCGDPKIACQDMLNDYVAARDLLQKYPGRLMVIRFEELAMEPYDVSARILKFLGHSVTGPVYEYLNKHTNATKPFSNTYRVSSRVPFKWKNRMDFVAVSEIQEVCKLAMKKWGYKMAFNETHMRSEDFNPLDDYTI